MDCRSLFLALVLFGFFASPCLAECGYDSVTTAGTSGDAAITCASLEVVGSYFEVLGFHVVPSLSITFRDAVFLGSEGAQSRLQVTGVYHSNGGDIEVMSAGGLGRGSLLHWHVAWGTELASSMLQHELVHAFAASVHPHPVPRIWSELIAYIVQFELMSDSLRDEVLAGYPHALPLSPSEICDDTYLSDPDLFAVRAYLYSESQGGSAYVGRLLRGEVPAASAVPTACLDSSGL